MEPTFDGENLEEIKAPECFEIEVVFSGTGASAIATAKFNLSLGAWRPLSR